MPGVSEFLSPRVVLVILAASVTANVFLAYRIFDTALSLDYARAELVALRTRSTQALAVIQQMARRVSRDEISALVPELSRQGIVVKSQPGEVQIGDVVFTFSGERASSVAYSE